MEYIAYIKPIGYTNTSVICGLCNEPGVIWINEAENVAYMGCQRIFEGPNAFTKMKADDSGIYK